MLLFSAQIGLVMNLSKIVSQSLVKLFLICATFKRYAPTFHDPKKICCNHRDSKMICCVFRDLYCDFAQLKSQAQVKIFGRAMNNFANQFGRDINRGPRTVQHSFWTFSFCHRAFGLFPIQVFQWFICPQ